MEVVSQSLSINNIPYDFSTTDKIKNWRENLTKEDLEGGDLGGTGAYSDIFGDPALFEEFGGQGN